MYMLYIYIYIDETIYKRMDTEGEEQKIKMRASSACGVAKQRLDM